MPQTVVYKQPSEQFNPQQPQQQQQQQASFVQPVQQSVPQLQNAYYQAPPQQQQQQQVPQPQQQSSYLGTSQQLPQGAAGMAQNQPSQPRVHQEQTGMEEDPLANKPASLLGDLRVLTFGASRTWGAGMPDRFDAYPYVLSKTATNHAIRASGPEYPSLCTYSMVGDEIYDVIVLEFYMDARNLLRLATRLRQRFPRAKIFVLRVWGPMQFTYTPSGGNNNNKPVHMRDFVRDWKENHATSSEYTVNHPEFAQYVREHTRAEEWSFNAHEGSIERQEQVLKAIDGILIEVPVHPDLREALAFNSPLTSHDLVHWSKDGHNYVARRIQDQLMRMNAMRRDDSVNPWDSKDFCLSWYESGESSLRHSPSVELNKFTPDRAEHKGRDYNGKYAMDAPYGKDNWIQVYNPDPEPAVVFARFMTVGPPPSKYPQTVLRMTNAVEGQQGVMVNPVVNDYNHYVHVNRLKQVGTIPHGESIMQIIPQESGMEYPFRITGIVVTNLSKADNLQTQQEI